MAVGRPTWNELDHRAIWRGIRAFLVIAVPGGVLARVTHSGVWPLVAVVLLFIAPIVGGAVAASSGERGPLTQSAVAVAAPMAVYLVVRILDGIVRGNLKLILVVSLPLYVVIVVGLGMIGGYIGFRRRTRAA